MMIDGIICHSVSQRHYAVMCENIYVCLSFCVVVGIVECGPICLCVVVSGSM